MGLFKKDSPKAGPSRPSARRDPSIPPPMGRLTSKNIEKRNKESPVMSLALLRDDFKIHCSTPSEATSTSLEEDKFQARPWTLSEADSLPRPSSGPSQYTSRPGSAASAAQRSCYSDDSYDDDYDDGYDDVHGRGYDEVHDDSHDDVHDDVHDNVHDYGYDDVYDDGYDSYTESSASTWSNSTYRRTPADELHLTMHERIIAANKRRIARAAKERDDDQVQAAFLRRKHAAEATGFKRRPQNLPTTWQRKVTGWRGIGGALREEEELEKLSQGLKPSNPEEDGDWEADDKSRTTQPVSMSPKEQMARAYEDYRQGRSNGPELSVGPKYVQDRNWPAMEKDALMSGALAAEPAGESHRRHESAGKSQVPDSKPHEAEHGRSSKSKSRRLHGKGSRPRNMPATLQAQFPDTSRIHRPQVDRAPNLKSRNAENTRSRQSAPLEKSTSPNNTATEKLVMVCPAPTTKSPPEGSRSDPARESREQPNDTKRRHDGKRRGERSHEPAVQKVSQKPSLQKLSVKADSAVEWVSEDEKQGTGANVPVAADGGPSIQANLPSASDGGPPPAQEPSTDARKRPRKIPTRHYIAWWLKKLRHPSSCDRLHTPWADNLVDMLQRQPAKDVESLDPSILAICEIEFGESSGGVECFNYGYDPYDGFTEASDNALAAPIRPMFSREEALAKLDFGFPPKGTSPHVREDLKPASSSRVEETELSASEIIGIALSDPSSNFSQFPQETGRQEADLFVPVPNREEESPAPEDVDRTGPSDKNSVVETTIRVSSSEADIGPSEFTLPASGGVNEDSGLCFSRQVWTYPVRRDLGKRPGFSTAEEPEQSKSEQEKGERDSQHNKLPSSDIGA